MKIVHITPSYKPAYIYGGPTMSVAKLCEALVEDEVEVEVFTTTANGVHELAVEPGKKVIVDGVPVTYFKRITKDHTHFSPALLSALRRKIKACQTTKNDLGKTPRELILHIHSWWNLVTLLSCLMAKLYQVPVVLSPRGMLTSYTQNNRNSILKSIIHRLIGKSLLKYCHIIASSKQEKQDILKIISPQSITVIPNLVNLPLQFSITRDPLTASDPSRKNNGRPTKNEPLKAEKGAFKLLFLSRIEEKKGLELLFEALAQLTISWQFNIGGAGQADYVERLKQKTLQLKLNDRISWLGQIANKDKFELMAWNDLLVLTSHNENFANVIIESLSSGTPVLVSNQVGLSDYILTNDLGFVTNLSVAEIAAAIENAYAQVSKRNKINAIAPALIKKDFDDRYLAKQYLQHYHHILNTSE